MPSRHFLLLLTVLGALLIAGCGSSDEPIPKDEAERLLAELDALQDEVTSGLCDDADSTLTDLSLAVNDLGGNVDRDVRDGLAELVGNLDSLIGQCSGEEPPTATTSDETTTTTTTETTSDTTDTTDTTTTDTTDTTTTDTTTDTTDPVPPVDGGGGVGPSRKGDD